MFNSFLNLYDLVIGVGGIYEKKIRECIPQSGSS